MRQGDNDVIKRVILILREYHETFLGTVEPATHKIWTESRNVSHHTVFDWNQETILLVGLDGFRRKWPGGSMKA